MWTTGWTVVPFTERGNKFGGGEWTEDDEFFVYADLRYLWNIQ